MPEAPSGIWFRLVPPIWAITFVLIALAVDHLFDWSGLALIISRPASFLLILAGAGVAAWAVLLFRSTGAEILPTSEVNSKLLTDGPFQLSRNPMYTGLVAITLGIAFYVGTLPYFLAAGGLFLMIDRVFIPFEEAKMQRQYGPQFAEYMERVRRWL